MTTQGIKDENHSNPYDSVYKLIRQFLNFRQAEDESRDKFLKRSLELSSLIKLSGIYATNQITMKDIECKKLIKSDPRNNVTLENKEAALSSSEALTEMVLLSSSDYNRFGPLISDLRQDMPRGKINYPRTFTNEYCMLTLFDLADPRHHHIGRTGDKGNGKNHGGRGRRDHTLVQHIAPLGTVLVKDIVTLMSYCIKCFNSEKWVHYENQCPEPTRDETPKTQDKIWHKLGGVLHKALVVVQ